MGKIPNELPFTLNHSISVGEHSAGPHREKLTPVPIIRAVKSLEGLSPQDVDKFLLDLAKKHEEEEKETKGFESIPAHDLLTGNGLDSFEKVLEYHAEEGLQTIDGVGPKYEDQILAYCKEQGYELKSETEEPLDEETDVETDGEAEQESEEEPENDGESEDEEAEPTEEAPAYTEEESSKE